MARRSFIHPSASKYGRAAAPTRSSTTSSLRCRCSASSSSAAVCICCAPTSSSTRTKLPSQKSGEDGVRKTTPCAHGAAASHITSSCARRQAMASARRSVVAVLLGAAAADHDLVFLDRDLDWPVAGPVLGVDRIVLDGGVQPQAVALLAVVERALQRTRRCGSATWAPAAPAGGAFGVVLVVPRLFLGGLARGFLGRAGLLFGGLARGLFFGLARLFLRLAGGFLLEFCGDLRVVFRAQIDLLDRPVALVGVGLEPLLALERLDLLDGHFQLVRDPRIGATLSHPPADLVKLRTQGPAAHRRAGD